MSSQLFDPAVAIWKIMGCLCSNQSLGGGLDLAHALYSASPIVEIEVGPKKYTIKNVCGSFCVYIKL